MGVFVFVVMTVRLDYKELEGLNRLSGDKLVPPPLEELHLALVFFSRGTRREGPKVSPFPCFGIPGPRV